MHGHTELRQALSRRYLRAVRFIAARQLGGADSLLLWVPTPLEHLVDCSRTELPLQLRLEAVHGLHDLLLLPGSLALLTRSGQALQCDQLLEGGLKEADRLAVWKEVAETGVAVVAILSQQPAWLQALAQRLDDSNSSVRAAAIRALAALMAAMAEGGDPAEGPSRVLSVVLSTLVLRQQGDPSQEVQQGVAQFLEAPPCFASEVSSARASC